MAIVPALDHITMYYDRPGQDLNSHLQANIREYKKELAEDLEKAELHRKIAEVDQDRQFKEVKVKVGEK